MHKKTETFIHKVLHILEFVIALLTLAVLVGMVGLELYRMVSVEGYFNSVDTFLHHVLTIVVGLEFVRMLVDLTPANTLEVLIVAISRHVILTHDDPWTIVACVLSIAALFATRHFLIPKAELSVEMSEVVDEEEAESPEEAQEACVE